MPRLTLPRFLRAGPVSFLAARLRGMIGRRSPGTQAGKPEIPGADDSPAVTAARALLWWEAVWPCLWRPLSVAGLFLAAAWMGLFLHLPLWLHIPILLATLAAIAWYGRRGWREFQVPTPDAARRRLERDSHLAHRPLTQLRDGIAGGAGDPLAHALWRMAQERARQQATRLRLGAPDSGLAARDPWALRVAVALCLVVGATVGWGDLPARTAAALLPMPGLSGLMAPTRLDAWATPPDYTGQAPVFLTGNRAAGGEQPDSLFLPAGTKLSIRLDGGYGTPVLLANEGETDFQPVAGGGYQIELPLTAGEGVTIRQFGRTVASWPIKLIPDQPPGIAFRTPPQATERNAVRIDYTAADDYGIQSVTATLTLAIDTPPTIDRTPIDLSLPVPARNKREVSAAGFHDLTSHPWAGLPVSIRLRAQDGAGQTSFSGEKTLVLPERQFTHPVARAIIEQRKSLILMGDAVRAVAARALSDLSVRLDAYGADPLAFLALRSAVGRLMLNGAPDTVPSTVAMLWDVALRIEDGNLSLAERELRDAQQALMDALDRNAPADEIDQAMQRLDQAMREFMNALEQQAARQAQQDGQPPAPADDQMPPDTQVMSREEVQDLVRQMRDLAQAGNHEAARQMLTELQQMMENLQNGQPQQQQQEADRKANEQGKALAELAEKLRNLQKQQQKLMDETFQQQQAQQEGAEEMAPNQLPGLGMPRRQSRRPDGSQGGNRQDTAKALAPMAEQQEELRGDLGEVMRRMGELGGEIPNSLGRAEYAMRDSTEALRDGTPDQAVAAQAEVLEQIQQTLQSMQEQMSRATPGQAGGKQAQRGRQPGRDPLGRPQQGNGSMNGEEVKIPAQADMQRAREILEELRRRASEQNRPKAERDYIDRLLDRFKAY